MGCGSATLSPPAVHRGTSEEALRELLAGAGVAIGGDAAYDITVHDDRFYKRVMRDGTLGFGETYMLGWWDSPAIDQLTCKLLSANLAHGATQPPIARACAQGTSAQPAVSWTRVEVAEQHYDLGNDLFEAMLDRELNYSCAYWKHASNFKRRRSPSSISYAERWGCGPEWRSILSHVALLPAHVGRQLPRPVSATVSGRHDPRWARASGLPAQLTSIVM